MFVCLMRFSQSTIYDTLVAMRLKLKRGITKYTKVSSLKKLKSTNHDAVPSPLSSEQLDRIEKNKRAALERLCARNVPEGFEDSWRNALIAEFGKPYYIKVYFTFLRSMMYLFLNGKFTWFCVVKEVFPCLW